MTGEPHRRIREAAKQLELAADDLEAQWPALAAHLHDDAEKHRDVADSVVLPDGGDRQ
jgi:hypothetical protein